MIKVNFRFLEQTKMFFLSIPTDVLQLLREHINSLTIQKLFPNQNQLIAVYTIDKTLAVGIWEPAKRENRFLYRVKQTRTCFEVYANGLVPWASVEHKRSLEVIRIFVYFAMYPTSYYREMTCKLKNGK